MKITYLLNSGFIVKMQSCALVFDAYEDPAGNIAETIKDCEEVYFFASHAHFDHFDPRIKDFADCTTRYFLSCDIRRTKRVRQLPAEKIVYLKTYDSYKDDQIKISSYDSTDAGTSFLVEKNGWRIFHAGDFNWWHWKGDTAENNSLAKNGFMKQMKRLDGLEADVAFFPLDGRLEEFAEDGAREFCRRTNVKQLIGMHRVGYGAWEPGSGFFPTGKVIPCWVPTAPGESREFKK